MAKADTRKVNQTQAARRLVKYHLGQLANDLRISEEALWTITEANPSKVAKFVNVSNGR